LSTLIVAQKLGQMGKRLIEQANSEVYQFTLLVAAAVAYVLSAYWCVVAYPAAAFSPLSSTFLGVALTALVFLKVEMSDESEGEDDDVDEDYTRLSSFLHRHSAIEEVDEDGTEDNGTAPTHTPQPHQDLTLPEQEGDDMEALTATAPSFPALAG
ncbi:hypothetical protein F5878DRAFT_647996, partial [Lentinula raphanica]